MRPSISIPFRQWLVFFVLTFSIAPKIAFSGDPEKNSAVKVEIANLLKKWPVDFNAKNIQAVCSLFAPDLVASYPGTTDRSYQEMCKQLTAVLKDPDKFLRYEAPEIEEIIINDDLAIVRLIWTLKTSGKYHSTVTTLREKGLDVFKKQPDGSWKIAISFAYPEQ